MLVQPGTAPHPQGAHRGSKKSHKTAGKRIAPSNPCAGGPADEQQRAKVSLACSSFPATASTCVAARSVLVRLPLPLPLLLIRRAAGACTEARVER
jgi:hypothetical protein